MSSLDLAVSCCSPDAVEQYGSTALQGAVVNGRRSAVKMLLGHGASPNSFNSTCGTPLQWTCSVGHEAIAGMLLRAGGDLYAPHPSVRTRGNAID
jgi:ankyrin repeat protein